MFFVFSIFGVDVSFSMESPYEQPYNNVGNEVYPAENDPADSELIDVSSSDDMSAVVRSAIKNNFGIDEKTLRRRSNNFGDSSFTDNNSRSSSIGHAHDERDGISSRESARSGEHIIRSFSTNPSFLSNNSDSLSAGGLSSSRQQHAPRDNSIAIGNGRYSVKQRYSASGEAKETDGYFRKKSGGCSSAS